jgi:hypothetical protein
MGTGKEYNGIVSSLLRIHREEGAPSAGHCAYRARVACRPLSSPALRIFLSPHGAPGVRCARQRTSRRAGWRGYFKGNGTNVIRVAPSNAIRFWCFELIKARMLTPVRYRCRCRSCMLLPLLLLCAAAERTASRPRAKRWASSTLARSAATSLGGAARALTAAVVQEKKRLTDAENVVAGAGAGLASTMATYPLDLLRSRLRRALQPCQGARAGWLAGWQFPFRFHRVPRRR